METVLASHQLVGGAKYPSNEESKNAVGAAYPGEQVVNFLVIVLLSIKHIINNVSSGCGTKGLFSRKRELGTNNELGPN
jgi:hypothetical protein